ncbi:ABC transporter permease subunit [Bacteriovoracaceae bacterium]|nr:ABC transporter permease subunit [Bacteriovoracaceae bacterium]|tara:strand:- start:94810 stop:95820 length:1011 start_codon:yes stop_codon:yes gene_type:complete
MIEKYIENELTLKRWKRFKNRKSAYYSAWFFLLCLLLTFSAPLISNSKPLYISYEGKSYFPVFKSYHPKEFGISNSMVVNYRTLEVDSIVWPIYEWDPFESNKTVDFYPSKPSSDNIFGTDESGRDVFSRILYGFKYSIIYAFLVWFFSLILGSILGGIMGYVGGKTDLIGQRVVEMFSTIPQFFLLLILISIFPASVLMLVIISTIFGWIPISYYIRAEFLKNRNREFVEAARANGASTARILTKHIFPNSLTPVITFAPFIISGHIIGLASLDYLGFGLPVPTPSWGELLSQAQKHFTVAWWLAVYPSIALAVTLTTLNLIGEGVRDAMDPNLS